MKPRTFAWVVVLGATLAGVRAAPASPGARRHFPIVLGPASRAPGDVELETFWEPAWRDVGQQRTRSFRLTWGATVTLGENAELAAHTTALQPPAGAGDPAATGARLEAISAALSYRVFGRTVDGAARSFEPKLLVQWTVPLSADYDSAPEGLLTSQILEERVLLGGKALRWLWTVSGGLAQTFGGAAEDSGVAFTFGAGVSNEIGDDERAPWARHTLGLEVFGELPIEGPVAHAIPGDPGAAIHAGPNWTFAVGRFWLAAGLYPSVQDPMKLRTRIIFAYAL